MNKKLHCSSFKMQIDTITSKATTPDLAVLGTEPRAADMLL